MLSRALRVGAVGGAIGAVSMGAFAMIAAATYQDTGVFTPLYHIASPLIGTDTMMESMGVTLFRAGPAAVGLAVHLSVGIAFGVLFGSLAWRLALRGVQAVAAGIVYGVAVMLFMAFIGLPITGAVLRGGDMVSDMATLVGWGTFLVEHVIYGLVVGITWTALGKGIPARPVPAPVRA